MQQTCSPEFKSVAIMPFKRNIIQIQIFNDIQGKTYPNRSILYNVGYQYYKHSPRNTLSSVYHQFKFSVECVSHKCDHRHLASATTEACGVSFVVIRLSRAIYPHGNQGSNHRICPKPHRKYCMHSIQQNLLKLTFNNSQCGLCIQGLTISTNWCLLSACP